MFGKKKANKNKNTSDQQDFDPYKKSGKKTKAETGRADDTPKFSVDTHNGENSTESNESPSSSQSFDLEGKKKSFQVDTDPNDEGGKDFSLGSSKKKSEVKGKGIKIKGSDAETSVERKMTVLQKILIVISTLAVLGGTVIVVLNYLESQRLAEEERRQSLVQLPSDEMLDQVGSNSEEDDPDLDDYIEDIEVIEVADLYDLPSEEGYVRYTNGYVRLAFLYPETWFFRERTSEGFDILSDLANEGEFFAYSNELREEDILPLVEFSTSNKETFRLVYYLVSNDYEWYENGILGSRAVERMNTSLAEEVTTNLQYLAFKYESLGDLSYRSNQSGFDFGYYQKQKLNLVCHN